MSYIGEHTGVAIGPLRIQSNGPWLRYTEENNVNALHIDMPNANNAAYNNIMCIATPISTLVKKEDGSIVCESNADAVINVEWFMQAVNFINTDGGGVTIDTSNFLLKQDAAATYETIVNVDAIRKDLQDTQKRVTILEKDWIIDGGSPNFSKRSY